MIGASLNDRYRLESELGRGGMGVVYRGRDSLLERDVAVKLMSATQLGDEGQARLLLEARAAASLQHPNIVAIFDISQAESPDQPGESTLFIVMEYVQGQTLSGYRPGSSDEVIHIALQICAALEQAHNANIVHRDLKPENVILDQNNTIKLMDFGLAQVSGRTRLTQEGAVVGTFAYMAPEVIQGDDASPQSDLYALGVILYELAAGRPPFAGDTVTAILSQHLHAPVVPPTVHQASIPPVLDRLIVQLLEKRPEKRPGSAAEVRQTLEQALAPAPAPGPQAPSSQLDHLARGRLIGREREYEQARLIWQNASAGRRQVLLISGEPGIGKTRLVQEIATTAELSGGRVLTADCFDQEGLPFLPIAQLIRGALANGAPDLPLDTITDLATIAPDLGHGRPDLSIRTLSDREVDQLRLYESFVTLCQALTSRAPLLLFVDDIHWTDSGSLELLRHLIRRSDDLPLMLILTYREVDLTQKKPVSRALRELERDRLATRIKIARLDRQQNREMLAALLGEEGPAEFQDAIYKETEGNPFFVEEICKVLVESGRLTFEGGNWRLPDLEELQIPQSIQVTLETRLERLAEEALHVLQVAALFGREFRFDMLQTVLQAIDGLSEDDLLDALEEAEENQIIKEARELRPEVGRGKLREPAFIFSHALFQTTLLTELSALRLRRLKRQVALALEEAYPDQLDSLAPLLGRYFAETGEDEKAIAYLLPTGDAARRLFSYEEAIEAYESAVLLQRELSLDDQAARTLMKLGLIYNNVFDFERSRRAYQEAFSLQRQRASASTASELPTAPHAFRFPFMDEPATLDPGRSDEGIMVPEFFSGLLKLTPEFDVEPDIAQSWDVLDDGHTYVFHLRPDITWSDGQPVTAEDFVYGWRRALDPKKGSPMASMLYDVKGAAAWHQGREVEPEYLGITAPDARTVRVELERPASYFLQIMPQSPAMPVPRHVVKTLGENWADPEHIVTNGPFLLASWGRGKSMILKRNLGYHGQVQGNVYEVELRAYMETEEMLADYEADSLDVLNLWAFPEEELFRLSRQYADDYRIWDTSLTGFIGFGVKHPPFDDPRVRRAFVLATDRQAPPAANQMRRGVPVRGGFVPPSIPGHVPGIALPYDLDGARTLLAEAGYPGGRGIPTLTAIVPPWDQEVPAVVFEPWEKNLGVKIDWEVEGWDVYQERVRREKIHLFMYGAGAFYPDPDSMLRVNMEIISQWQYEPYDTLVQQARGLKDHAQRMALYRQAEQILAQEAPIMPWISVYQHLVVKPWVRNFRRFETAISHYRDIIVDPH